MVCALRSFRLLTAIVAAVAPATGPGPAAAQPVPVHRVADLETDARNPGSFAIDFAEAGGVYYFSEDDGLHGQELWRTDGTPDGTRLVADLCPGRCSSWPHALTGFAGEVYFTADDGTTGTELWRSDGSDRGTVLVRDVCPGACASEIAELAVFAGRLWFGTRNDAATVALWSSDGTAAGTRPVVVFSYPGAPPFGFTVFADRLFFTADDGTSGRELWSTDGTAAGTRLVRDICPDCGSWPLWLTPWKSHLYFTAYEPVHGSELWRTDGTAAGTTLVADLYPGSEGSGIYPIVPFGDRLYAVGSQCPAPPCAWRTDGTAAGTVPATELYPLGVRDFTPRLAAAGSKLFFTAWPGGSEPLELWTLGEDSAVAERVAAGFPRVWWLDDLRDGVLLWTDAGDEWRVWASDGTAAGTVPLTPSSLAISTIYPLGERAFFIAGDPTSFLEPWTTDGTPAGSHSLGDLSPLRPIPAAIPSLAAHGDRLAFGLFPSGGEEPPGLWISDGSAQGTVRAVEAAPLVPLVAAGGRLFFGGWQGADFGTFVSDATPAGTVRLTEAIGRELTVVGDEVFFGSDRFSGQELWATDGTPAGTRPLIDVNPGYGNPCFPDPPCFPRTPFPASLTAVGATLFFTGFADDAEAQLWRSDGTPAGTVAVRSFAVGEGRAEEEPPRDLVAFAGGLLFSAFEEATGRELWRSDGTSAGTVLLADLDPGPASSDVRHITVAGAAAYFVTGDAAGGERLWRLGQGSSSPTLVHDFAAVPGSFVRQVVAVGERLFPVVFSPATGAELWASDGTPAGTGLLRDLFPGPRGSSPRAFAAIDGRLLFAADDGERGVEPWVSDGTPAGTRLVADVYPGRQGSDAEAFTAAGPWVFFLAEDGEAGRELWVADRGALAAGAGACVADATTLCLNGGRFRVQVDWRTSLGTAGPGRVVPFGSDDSGLFWFFDPDNWELLIKVLRGCPVNDRYWVFFAATTNVEFTLRVTDTLTGASQPYDNPLGHRADAVTDTAAFATCP